MPPWASAAQCDHGLMEYPVVVTDLFKIDHVYTKCPITQQVWEYQGFARPRSWVRLIAPPKFNSKEIEKQNVYHYVIQRLLTAQRTPLVEHPLDVNSALCRRTVKSRVPYFARNFITP